MSDTRDSILVVDDKENMLRLLEKILGDRHDVTSVSDGSSALEVLRTRSFDVVLTDVRMPGADGFAVTRAVKERWPDSEVVMMTAYASIDAAVRAIKDGAYDYIQKPFDPDDVALVVARALERKRNRAQASKDARADDNDESLAHLSYKEAVSVARERISRSYLIDLLRTFNGNVTHAAERAGIERESLHRLLKRYDLRAEQFRAGPAPDAPKGPS